MDCLSSGACGKGRSGRRRRSLRPRGVVSALRVAMENARFPSVAGDAQGTPQRRSGRRLSDAEAVATTRLDMFGDTTLKDALAGAPPNEGGASNRAEPEAPGDQPPPFLEAAIVSAGPASPEPAAIEAVTQSVEAAAEPALSDAPQRLDTASD